MRIATWNINSVRLRKDNVIKFLKDYNIDILCLQETKVDDPLFPTSDFIAAGYKDVHFSGQKSYNGVAIISKISTIFNRKLQIVNEDKRHISAKFEFRNKEIELHNLYIPAGGDIPDPELNPKFHHKLEFTKELTKWFPKNCKDKEVIVVGDLNIAPYEHDVWSHKQLLKIVSHTPIEVELLNKFLKSMDFVDIAREFIPHDQKAYSWWSYRNNDWEKSNRGRRLDHIWATPKTAKLVKGFEIVKETRNWAVTSDHVPVIIEL